MAVTVWIPNQKAVLLRKAESFEGLKIRIIEYSKHVGVA